MSEAERAAERMSARELKYSVNATKKAVEWLNAREAEILSECGR